MDEAGSPPAGGDERARQVAMSRLAGEGLCATRDLVAREEPLEIQVGGRSLAVVMRTPGHDRELALGFLVTERAVASPADVAAVHHGSIFGRPDAEGNLVRVHLHEGVALDLEALRRNLFASSSCGICGKATIEQALRRAAPLEDETRFASGLFHGLPSRLRECQAIFADTGGLHAAALFDAEGRLLVAREDVGRHNAVDKVVGWALEQDRVPLSGHGLLVSGRISCEIALKALAARTPVVAAVSAPSSLAVALAEEAGMTLVAFLRDGGFNVYGRVARIDA